MDSVICTVVKKIVKPKEGPKLTYGQYVCIASMFDSDDYIGYEMISGRQVRFTPQQATDWLVWREIPDDEL